MNSPYKVGDLVWCIFSDTQRWAAGVVLSPLEYGSHYDHNKGAAFRYYHFCEAGGMVQSIPSKDGATARLAFTLDDLRPRFDNFDRATMSLEEMTRVTPRETA